MLKIVVHVQLVRLLLKSLGVHAGQDEAPYAASPAELHKLTGVRNDSYPQRRGIESLAVVIFEVLQPSLRNFDGIVIRVRQLKLRTERFAIQRGSPILSQHIICSLNRKGHIIAQSARPVKNQIAEHVEEGEIP